MAHLGCFSPRIGRENVHVDHAVAKGAAPTGGRELTLVFFCSPGWTDEQGGAFRAYMERDVDRPSQRPRCAVHHSSGSQSAPDESAHTDADAAGAETGLATDHFKDFEPEAGRCLIFQSKELWHE